MKIRQLGLSVAEVDVLLVALSCCERCGRCSDSKIQAVGVLRGRLAGLYTETCTASVPHLVTAAVRERCAACSLAGVRDE